jgi:D-alanyl-D-alanine carboxypeptidase
MARVFWVILAVGLGLVALATAPHRSNGTASVVPATADPATTAGTTAATTEAAPPRSTSTTAPRTATTSTTSPTSTVAKTTTTVASTTTTTLADDGRFDGAAFDAVIAAATTDRGDLSAGAAVLRNGTVLHTAAFGMEDPVTSTIATVKTRFRLASVSKMLTAIVIMQLVEEDSVQLDKPFASQLGIKGPFLDPRIATITVRQLLSHTSGFGEAHAIFFDHGVDTWQQAALSALGQPLDADPGTAFQYSNTNFCFLAMLIEEITGKPFEMAIRQRVLKPLGITAHIAPTVDTEPGDALHASTAGRNYMEVLGPAGAWVASPLDLAKLASSLRTDLPGTHLLTKATVDAMRVRVPMPVEDPPPANGWSYGMGLMLFADGSWGHTGTIESTHSVVVNRPDGLTISIMVSGLRPFNTDDLLPLIDEAVAAATAG